MKKKICFFAAVILAVLTLTSCLPPIAVYNEEMVKIKSLTESYSFKDIDKAVEDLQQYKLNVKSLPFSTLSEKRHTKAVIRESKEPLLTLKDNSSYNFDDDVDEALLTFTN